MRAIGAIDLKTCCDSVKVGIRIEGSGICYDGVKVKSIRIMLCIFVNQPAFSLPFRLFFFLVAGVCC